MLPMGKTRNSKSFEASQEVGAIIYCTSLIYGKKGYKILGCYVRSPRLLYKTTPFERLCFRIEITKTTVCFFTYMNFETATYFLSGCEFSLLR
jgi:hypothetical protein